MSRFTLSSFPPNQDVFDSFYQDLSRRFVATPPNICQVDMLASSLQMMYAQTCGKCVPCRVGLGSLQDMLQSVLSGKAKPDTLASMEALTKTIKDSADCAIGTEAADFVLRGLKECAEDFLSHIKQKVCTSSRIHQTTVPCVAYCPAHIDIPGYISLIHEKRYDDAVKLIRKDNPFATACGYICEHPCEEKCRRKMMDMSLNIRVLKRFATDHAQNVSTPPCAEPTGKKIAVVGGGPGGLTAAYFLQLMGHQVTVFEKRKYLGGMLRYGIPNYRFPRVQLQKDLDAILSTGITIHTETEIDGLSDFIRLRQDYDAVFLSIGSQLDKKLKLEGEDSQGVISAIDFLAEMGDNHFSDLQGKKVVVIGGGNVTMDAARSAIRLGASVQIAYRRRKEDMTALPEEIEGAIAEGCEILELCAPARIETNEQKQVKALWLQPQIIGPYDAQNRPKPRNADLPEIHLDCDIIIMAVGQSTDSKRFGEAGLPLKWDNFQANETGIENFPGVFAGGDCVSGPATVIRAIAAGKSAAAHIDEYLGYRHLIGTDVEIPSTPFAPVGACGKVIPAQRPCEERKQDFELVELNLSLEEAMQESSRCLRCDHFGLGGLKGGRNNQW
ncbi:glutamate synthase [Clostridia bacterium]|nr:glutamate synthase [Clostridia bacterium]